VALLYVILAIGVAIHIAQYRNDHPGIGYLTFLILVIKHHVAFNADRNFKEILPAIKAISVFFAFYVIGKEDFGG
jgi:uncharacterized membrane protein